MITALWKTNNCSYHLCLLVLIDIYLKTFFGFPTAQYNVIKITATVKIASVPRSKEEALELVAKLQLWCSKLI